MDVARVWFCQDSRAGTNGAARQSSCSLHVACMYMYMFMYAHVADVLGSLCRCLQEGKELAKQV